MSNGIAVSQNAVAHSNNDVAQLVWKYPAKIPNCLGFAVYRKEGALNGPSAWEPLPAWVGFEGQQNEAWKQRTTEIWPIQKFAWKDVTAERGKTYSYKIVPVTGNPDLGNPLAPIANEPVYVTNATTLTPQRGSCRAYFNRGILSTQFLTHQIKPGPSGAPNFKILRDRIDQPGDPLRISLSGQILDGVMDLLNRARDEGGSCYAALYELTDTELESGLLSQKNLHIILSNTGTDDAENIPARQALHEKGTINIIDRFVPGGHIGHNKFVVYVDSHNKPKAVLLGSTNWTANGLCAQSNNALIVENDALATAYLTYWNNLKRDTPPDSKGKQSAPLRKANAEPGAVDIPLDNGKATVWFSPNTPHARQSHPGPEEETPPDLKQVFELMEGAKEAIIFLVFQPGSPSIVDRAADIGNRKPNLFIRGAATDPKAAEVFNTTLIHRAGQEPVEVVPASAITDQFAFWQQELLKSGPTAHAIIHDKIVVIDPMTDNCVVVTGSHNVGFRASYNNDENLLITRGHRPLAEAYAVHVMDIYDHYRFRYIVQTQGTHAFSGLRRNDSWQDKYFDANNPASKDADIWF